MAKTAFLGLGVMGGPMAGHLAEAGHAVRVWNRTHAKAERWAEDHKGTAADTIAEAVEGAEVVLCCVGDDADVLAVAERAMPAMGAGAVFVDHTTTSADCARTCAATAARHGIRFMDAPISGGQSGAESGTLTVMCGAEAETFEAALPVMEPYARSVTRIGGVGAGQMAKMMNQICIAGTVQGLAEALDFGRRAGLDVGKVIDAIGGGAAQSWQMDNRAATMVEGRYDYGFALDWMIKDLGHAVRAAEAVGAEVTVAKLVEGYYRELSEAGDGRLDTSALLLRLAD